MTIYDLVVIGDAKPSDYFTRSGMARGVVEDRVWNVGGRPDPHECYKWAKANASASILTIDIEGLTLRISETTRLQASSNLDFYIEMLKAAKRGVRDGGGNALVGTYNFPMPACQTYARVYDSVAAGFAASVSKIELDEDWLEEQMPRLRPYLDYLMPSSYVVVHSTGWLAMFQSIIDADHAWATRVGYTGVTDRQVIPIIFPREHPSVDPTCAYLSETDRNNAWNYVLNKYGTGAVWNNNMVYPDSLNTWAANLASGWPNFIATKTGAGGW